MAIETSRYFRGHQKQPRGRGNWIFENKAGEAVFMHNGTYAEACKAARAANTETLYIAA